MNSNAYGLTINNIIMYYHKENQQTLPNIYKSKDIYNVYYQNVAFPEMHTFVRTKEETAQFYRYLNIHVTAFNVFKDVC